MIVDIGLFPFDASLDSAGSFLLFSLSPYLMYHFTSLFLLLISIVGLIDPFMILRIYMDEKSTIWN